MDNGWEGDDKISIEEYQEFTPTTFIVDKYYAKPYLLAGLVAEAGEISGQYAKFLRGDFDSDELHYRLRKELGDLMYFISQLCNELEWDTRDILQENVEKLTKRQTENKLRGDGDDR